MFIDLQNKVQLGKVRRFVVLCSTIMPFLHFYITSTACVVIGSNGEAKMNIHTLFIYVYVILHINQHCWLITWLRRCISGPYQSNETRIFFSSSLNKYPCFYIFPLEFGGVVNIHRIRPIGFRVKTAIVPSMKMLTCPRLHIHRKHVYKRFYINLKRDFAARKILWCPQRMKRTWGEIVTTPYTGFMVFIALL